MTRPFFEKDFQALLIEAAHLLGWHVYSIPDSRRATVKGWPDCVLWKVKPGTTRMIFAELKTDNGRISPEQKSVMADLEIIAAASGSMLETHIWRTKDWTAILKTLGGQEPLFDT